MLYYVYYHIYVYIIQTLGLVFGLGFSLLFKLPKPSAVSVGIETSQQNTGLCMAILMVTIKDDDQLDRALGIPIIYTMLCWIVNLIYIYILYKMGWTMRDDIDSNETEKEEINLCVLIQRYKEAKQKKKDETKHNKDNIKGNAIEDKSSSNLSVVATMSNTDKTKINEVALNSKETKRLQGAGCDSSEETENNTNIIVTNSNNASRRQSQTETVTADVDLLTNGNKFGNANQSVTVASTTTSTDVNVNDTVTAYLD